MVYLPPPPPPQKKRLLGKFGVLWLLLVSCFFSSCDLFLNKPDGDLTGAIDDAVAWSNADSVNVRIGVIPGSVSLITSDSALQSQKVGYAFTVSVTENPEWAFLDWDAVREADFPAYRAGNRSLAANAAAYASITGILDGGGNKTGEASVIVHTSEPFYLVPWCVERPRVTASSLPGNFTDRKLVNHPITIWFSKDLDPECIGFDNFILSARGSFGYGASLEGSAMNGYYYTPEVYGNVVTIRRNYQTSDDAVFKNLNITLKLDLGSIRDAEHGVSMGGEGKYQELYYGVRTEGYTTKPKVEYVEAAFVSNGDLFTGSGSPGNGIYADGRYVHTENGVPVIYLLFSKDDVDIDLTLAFLETLRITERREGASYSRGEQDYPYGIYGVETEGYVTLTTHYQRAHPGKTPYIVRHVIKSGDGIIELAVQPTDNFGNYYRFEDAPNKVRVVLDTTPPGEVGIGSSYDRNVKKLTLTWINPSAVDLEKVSLAWMKGGVSQDFSGSISPTPGGSVSLEFPDIEEGAVCNFTVTATDKAGNASHTEITVDTRDRSPPGLVTGLGASYDGASRTISFGWTNPGDADLKETRIIWGIKGQAQNTVVVPATPGTGGSRQLSLSAGDIQTTNTYVLSVKTADNAGNVSDGVTKEITLAGAPAGVTVSGAASDSITLSWNPVSEAGEYRVYRGSGAAGPYVLAGTSRAASYTMGGLSPETRCYFKVSGLIDSVEGSHSDYVYGITLSSVSAGIRARTVSPTSINVSWDEVMGAQEYKLYRSTAPDTGYSLVGALTAPAHEHTDTGLAPGTTCYYKVSVKTSGGESDLAAYAQAITAPGAPAPVVSSVSTASVSLSWLAVQGAVSYKVYRSGSGAGPFDTSIGTSTTTSFTDTGLTINTPYYYQVSAVNSGGEGDKSVPVSATTGADVPNAPNAPAGLTTTGQTPNSITLSWNGVTGAVSYKVYRGESVSGTYTQTGSNVTSNTFTDTELSAGRTYYYKVSAVNTGGESPQSSSIEAATTLNAPDVPAGVTATGRTSSSITLSWNRVTGAASYKVYRGESETGAYSPAGSPATTSFTDTGLPAGTTYYYKVSAVNAGGESPQSSSIEAATTLNAPMGLGSTGQTSSSITLNWNGVTGAASYRVYRSSTSDGTYTQTGSNATSNAFTDTGLSAGTTYYYKVSAVNAGGEGPKSNSVPGTTLADSTITVTIDRGQGAFSQGDFTVSKTGSQTQDIAVTGTGYSSPRWFVDGVQRGTGNSITVRAADYAAGVHSLSLLVEMEISGVNVPWSKEIDFTVTD
jgi:fibronectin type 3 domain-containing protein